MVVIENTSHFGKERHYTLCSGYHYINGSCTGQVSSESWNSFYFKSGFKDHNKVTYFEVEITF